MNYLTYKSGYIYLSGGGSYVTYNSVATGKYFIRVDATTGARDTSFLPSAGYGYGIPFIEQTLNYVFLSNGSTLSKITYSTGTSSSYPIPFYPGGSSSVYSYKFIEGTDFFIMGGSFGTGALNPNNLVLLKKSY